MAVRRAKRQPRALVAPTDGAEARRRARRIATAVVLALGTAATMVAIVANPDGAKHHWLHLALAATLGGIVGTAELVARYRDEPLLAVTSRAGGVYIGLNAVVSASVYGLLTRYAGSIVPTIDGDRLATSMVAGFGAMAVLRSKVFTIRTEKGEDIAIGPDAAITAFLNAADRAVDRSRASRRLQLVHHEARNLPKPVDSAAFLQVSLAAFQGLSNEEKLDLRTRLEAIGAQPYPDTLKLQAMCFLLLNVTGEQNFGDLVASLRDWEAQAGASRSPGAAAEVLTE